jgi:hypothetical protein
MQLSIKTTTKRKNKMNFANKILAFCPSNGVEELVDGKYIDLSFAPCESDNFDDDQIGAGALRLYVDQRFELLSFVAGEGCEFFTMSLDDFKMIVSDFLP